MSIIQLKFKGLLTRAEVMFQANQKDDPDFDVDLMSYIPSFF